MICDHCNLSNFWVKHFWENDRKLASSESIGVLQFCDEEVYSTVDAKMRIPETEPSLLTNQQ